MTVNQQLNKSRTTGNGVTVSFPANIKIFSETDIKVTTITTATDALSNTLILNDGGALGYTVTFDTELETLTVTVNTAVIATEDLQILRGLPQTQSTDFPRATSFPAKSNEDALDKNVMILQDQQEILNRSFVLPEESSATSPSLPDPTDRRALIWSGTNGVIINSVFDPDTNVAVTAASAAAANASAISSAADAVSTAADVVTTNADAVSTAADVVTTNAASSNAVAATGASAFKYTFSDLITMVDPGAGILRFNNATISSATAMAIDATSADSGNPDVSAFIATWADSTNAIKGHMTFRKEGAPSTFATFSISAVVDNTGWLQVTLLFVDGNGLLTDADTLYISFARSGNKGTIGTGTPASITETNAGVDAIKFTTPDGIAGSYAGTKLITFNLSDPAASLSIGNNKAFIHVPAALAGMNIVSVHAEVATASVGSAVTIQIHNATSAADILSTVLTIDAGETGSDTATVPAVISGTEDDLTLNDVIQLDIDGVGSTTAAKGLVVTIECRLP